MHQKFVNQNQYINLSYVQQKQMVNIRSAYNDHLYGGEYYRYVRWCCYITADSKTTALQNGACTYQYISKQMHYKTLFSHNGFIKNLEFYENYITLFCMEKKQICDIAILTENHAWQITQSGYNNYLV
jgi:hypothetical protein